jgi:hypothetical protein
MSSTVRRSKTAQLYFHGRPDKLSCLPCASRHESHRQGWRALMLCEALATPRSLIMSAPGLPKTKA